MDAPALSRQARARRGQKIGGQHKQTLHIERQLLLSFALELRSIYVITSAQASLFVRSRVGPKCINRAPRRTPAPFAYENFW